MGWLCKDLCVVTIWQRQTLQNQFFLNRNQPDIFKRHACINESDMKSINNNAPVKCSKTVIISANSEKVWAVLTDISNWPAWQTDISKSFLHGDLKPGRNFNWTSGGANILSTIHTVEPFSYFGWTGKAVGLFAVHNWILMETSGQTIVTVEESMEGFLAVLLRKSLNRNLEKGMHNWLALLKQACEKKQAIPA